jgi:hypothetical protein
MLDPRGIALHTDLSAKRGEYDHARETYVAAKASHAPRETVNGIVATCYEAGWDYAVALDRLLDYLATTAPSGERDAEIEQADSLKERIRRELERVTLV